MKNKLLLILALFVLLLLAACDDEVVIMPASLCQVTCTDDATGDTYGIALRAIAWNDESGNPDKHEGGDFGCNVYVDAYRGKMDENGEFTTAPVSVELDSTGATADSYDEDYTLTFFDLDGQGLSADDLPSLQEDSTALYQLLDESTIEITQTTSSIAAEYEHRINPCVMDAQLEMNVYCDTSEDDVEGVDDYIRIRCDPNDAAEIDEKNEGENNIQCEDNQENEACLDEDYEINEDDMTANHPSLQIVFDYLEEEFS